MSADTVEGAGRARREPTPVLMRYVAPSARLAVVVLTFVAILATFNGSAARGEVRFFDFFGYFTIQSNIIVAIVYLFVAIIGFTGGHQGFVAVLARALATTYIIVVGVVYNVLLAPVLAEGGVAVPWANAVLHIVIPIYAALDWLVFGDRWPVPWRTLGFVAIFPLVWCAVVLVRGATDGWVPYPFLNPSHGYLSVSLYVVGIAVLFMGAGALVWAVSRWRGLIPVPERDPSPFD